MRWQPALRIAAPYFDDPAYIDGARHVARAALAKLPFKPEMILASFHGIPQEYFDKGDPYYCQCAKTTRLLREAAQARRDKLMLTFQSRFGLAEWLKPYTDATVKALAGAGREESRRHHAGLFRRLPGDAGRDRHGECRKSSSMPAARISPPSPASTTQRPGMAVIRDVVARELQGLDLSPKPARGRSGINGSLTIRVLTPLTKARWPAGGSLAKRGPRPSRSRGCGRGR